MPGAAEYEELIGVKGIGTSGMDAQSVAHFVIVLFIFLGNLGYFIERKRSKKHQVIIMDILGAWIAVFSL